MFQQLTMHRRLALVLWGAALLVFVVVGVGVALFQNLTLEHRVRQIMEPYAQLILVGTDAAVAFEDPARAQEILATLRANPQILEADIFLENGRVLASFGHSPDVKPEPLPTRPDGVYVGQTNAELLQALPRGARLRLTMGLDQLSQQTRQTLWIFGIGALALLAVTLAQFSVLRRTIVRRIASLTEATELVRSSAAYQQRVPASGDDEVARLGQSFNAMMEAIQARDSELRRLTDFQRTILDNVAYGIISATPDGLVTSFNPAAERLLGYAAEEAVGKASVELWHDPEEIARRALQVSAELGEPIAPGFDVFSAAPRRKQLEENEWTFIRKDGTRVPVLLSVSALRDESGEITGFVGMTYDLSERKQAEEEIRLLNRELEQRVVERTAQLETTNRELEDFTYSVSHDLRTPLRHIDGFLAMLRNRIGPTLDDESRRYMTTISNAALRMAALIDDLLSFSRSGRFEMTRTRVNLGDLVKEIIREYEPESKDRPVNWKLAELPVVTGDRAMLRAVLVNLISNAVKFTQPRSPAEIEIGCLSDQTTETIIFVRDNGVGFDMRYANKLFRVFERLHGVHEFEGTGIGLANVRRVISRHGGRTWADGKVGGGATFYFSLPHASAENL